MKISRNHCYIGMLAFALLTSFLIISCSKSPTLLPYDQSKTQWDDTIDKHISDTQRAKRLKQLGIQLDKLQQSLATDIEQLRKDGVSLNEDYYSTKQDIESLFGDFTAKRDVVLHQYKEIIFSMKAEVTSDEWEDLIN